MIRNGVVFLWSFKVSNDVNYIMNIKISVINEIVMLGYRLKIAFI